MREYWLNYRAMWDGMGCGTFRRVFSEPGVDAFTQLCIKRRFDPCTPNPCGPNTECTVSGDRAICACNRGYTGDPNSRSVGCRADPCAVADPCGRNAVCENQASSELFQSIPKLNQ